MRQARQPLSKVRTREDKAMALVSRLNLARGDRIDALIAGHTAETFAKAHGVTVGMIRETFEQAVQRRLDHG